MLYKNHEIFNACLWTHLFLTQIVPEVVLAKEAGISYAAVAMVTDYDCWRGDESESVDVPKVMKQMSNCSFCLSLASCFFRFFSSLSASAFFNPRATLRSSIISATFRRLLDGLSLSAFRLIRLSLSAAAVRPRSKLGEDLARLSTRRGGGGGGGGGWGAGGFTLRVLARLNGFISELNWTSSMQAPQHRVFTPGHASSTNHE